MPAPLRLRLDQETREAVAERYEQACTPIERTNGQVVLLADEGRTVTEIAWLVRRGRDQVRRSCAASAPRAWRGWRRASTPGDRSGSRPPNSAAHPHAQACLTFALS